MSRKPGRWRRLGLNLALSLVIVLVLALLLEGVLRVTGAAYDPQLDRSGPSPFVDSPDPEIRRELLPNFDGMVLGARFRTNSFGMRGPETTREKPAGTFRIAVLGDSWAFGWGVDQGEDFPAQLQTILQRQAGAGEPRYEVLNFAVSAYNTLQERAVLRTKALAFEPDLVVVAFNINDVEEPKPRDAREDTLDLRLRQFERDLAAHSHLVRLIDDRLRRLALRMDMERSGKIDHYHALYAEDSGPWIRARDALGDIRDLAAEAGAATYLVHCPWMNVLSEENPYRDIHRQVLAAAAEAGIPALDLFDTFRGRDATELRISPLDGHPRAEGHRIAAEAIAGDLRARGLVGQVAGTPGSER